LQSYNAGLYPLPTIADGAEYADSGGGGVRSRSRKNRSPRSRKLLRSSRRNATLDVRGEFFNAFHHSEYGDPATAFGTARFGYIESTSVAPGVSS
jgi:hypothetical protein